MEPARIPLRNRKGETIEHALVDQDDFDEAMKYKWHIINNKKRRYVQGEIDNKKILLHHFIIGKTKNGEVVDHRNGNGLDNTRDNLRFVSKKVNSNNRETLTENKTSSYIGVTKVKDSQKYTVRCGNNNLGRFEDPKKGAEMYDICSFLVYGKEARNNGLVTYEDAIKHKLEDILAKKKERELPPNIYKKHDKYVVEIVYDKLYKSKAVPTVEEAIKEFEKLQLQIDEVKKREEEEHRKRPILRNENGHAIVPLSNKEGMHTIVDDELWHNLILKKLWMSVDGYIIGTLDKKEMLLHRYVYEMYYKELPNIIDHSNKIRHDNRIANIRENCASGNAHNKSKTKDATSKYYGVYLDRRCNKWLSFINKDGKQHYVGLFKDEKEAALAYNKKASELYGDKANLNVF